MRYQIYEAKSVKYDAQQRLSGNRPTFMCLYGMELFHGGGLHCVACGFGNCVLSANGATPTRRPSLVAGRRTGQGLEFWHNTSEHPISPFGRG